MSPKQKSGNKKSLIEMVKDPSILVIPGVYDPLTARIAADCGFPAILAGGYAVSATHLGLPDMEMITPTEMLDTVRRMRAVVDVPIVADIDTGGGALLNIRRVIKGMELAGASGIQIEDQFFPKRAGLTRRTRSCKTKRHGYAFESGNRCPHNGSVNYCPDRCRRPLRCNRPCKFILRTWGRLAFY